MKAYKTYEEAVERLSQVVALLEQGGLPLEESLKLFEEGTKLTSVLLRRAQGRAAENRSVGRTGGANG